MKNIKLTPAIIVAAIFSVALFSNLDVSAQSCTKNVRTTLTQQSIGSINAEILVLERELANLEVVAKQNNINVGQPYNYSILNKTAYVAVTEEKATATK